MKKFFYFFLRLFKGTAECTMMRRIQNCIWWSQKCLEWKLILGWEKPGRNRNQLYKSTINIHVCISKYRFTFVRAFLLPIFGNVDESWRVTSKLRGSTLVQAARRRSKVFQKFSASLVQVGVVQGVPRWHAVGFLVFITGSYLYQVPGSASSPYRLFPFYLLFPKMSHFVSYIQYEAQFF